ncbi:prephenate dehydratase [Petroclostridium sp. X23]|uniref:prephenate dehydratase n=1 Tax=Petroclostridium sp. X23 TaxID=3045146 RepID=UPI0024AE82DA|nr:prephenate dehydratase [Petroclostridium sp. X23]WHH57551.1 prephenate dehydratase [Petroclostridium sp. X23]
MKVGFMGPKGTFTQQAADIYAGNTSAELVEYTNIAELIHAIYNGEVDEGVVPIENSIEGSVNVTLDMMAWNVDLKIKKEIIIPIKHNFMVRKGKKDVSLILSHPQAVGQCRAFLNKYYPKVPVQYAYSTAQAAQQVASSAENWAAIAAPKAAMEYDLESLYQSIQDHDSNVTRFIVLSHDYSNEENQRKTSIIFSTDNKPGSLYRVLQILNLWDINMTRIESRPAKNSLGSYIFFVDIEGNWQQSDVRDALTMIRRKTSFFKMLGSYAVESYDC